MLSFLDTNVFLYAAGSSHRLREPCQEILRRVADGNLFAITSTEVVQELLYVLDRRGRGADGIRLSRRVLLLFPP